MQLVGSLIEQLYFVH